MIGNGNVALDVARMLALTPEELEPTDTTDPAIEAIGGCDDSRDRRRRPPRPGPGLLDDPGAEGARRARRRRRRRRSRRAGARRGERGLARGRHQRSAQHGGAARLRRARADGQARDRRLRFLASPVALHGDDKVESIELVRNRLEEQDGRLVAVPTERARDDRVRSRVSERRLPRRRPAGASLRRAARHDPKRARPRRGRRRRARRRGRIAPAGSSAARRGSSAPTRRTRPRRSPSCSRTSSRGSWVTVTRSTRRRGRGLACRTGRPGGPVPGLDLDRRARAGRRGEARPSAGEAPYLGRVARGGRASGSRDRLTQFLCTDWSRSATFQGQSLEPGSDGHVPRQPSPSRGTPISPRRRK